MKYYFSIVLVFILLSCSSDDTKPEIENEDLLGKWRLIEQLADPGDGSGTFNPVESDRVIEFFSDGTVTVNGSLCYMSTKVETNASGTYQVTSDDTSDTTFDGIITSDNCQFSDFRIYFDLPLSGNLILWYPCIEGCGQKFKKI